MRFDLSDGLVTCIKSVYDMDQLDISDDNKIIIDGTLLNDDTPMTHADNVTLFVCLNIQLIALRTIGKHIYMIEPRDVIRTYNNVFIIVGHEHYTPDTYNDQLVIHKPYDVKSKFIVNELSDNMMYPHYVPKHVGNGSVSRICNLYQVDKHSKLYYAIQLSSSYPYLFLYI
jgi:hypothetical protein